LNEGAIDMTSKARKSGERIGKAKAAELSEQELDQVAGGTDPAGRTYVGTANGGVWKTTDGAAEGTPDIIVAAGQGTNAHVK
jgi:hypothetical protein